MARVDLPPGVRPGCALLARLDESGFDRLVTQLDVSGDEISAVTLCKKIAKTLQVTQSEARDVWHSLYYIHSAEREFRANVIADVVGALEDEFPNQADKLKSRFKTLQEIEPLAAVQKSMDLLLRNTANYLSARAVTDLRPVFLEVPHDPAAFVLVHELDIEFRDNSRDRAHDSANRRHFFVALDEVDLDDLIAVLKRSKQKAESLKSFLKENGMPFLTTNREF